MNVIAFDLHDVVFKMDYRKVASILWRTSPKLPLMATSLHPRFWANVAKLAYKDAVGEEYVMRMAQWHTPLRPYIPTGIQIINAQQPIKPVVDIMQQLKNNDHKLIAFSNIGQQAYADLCTQFPDVMNLFDDAVYTSIEDDYIRKPKIAAYEKLIAMADASAQDILFIDNKRKNIQAATQHQINAIWYQNPKQLHRQLKQYINF